MDLRKATVEDALTIAHVHIESWRAAYRNIVPDDRLADLDSEYMAEKFRETIRTGSEDIHIAQESGRIVGMLALGDSRDADVDNRTTREILALYLLPEWWRRGIGRAMWQESERTLKMQGYSRVVLWVIEDNERARRFYDAMGFTPDGSKKVLNIGAPLKAIRCARSI